MRIALIGPTVGQTRRGYERFLTDLFRQLRPSVDVTLFKGGGDPGPNEIVVPHLRRTGVLERMFGRRLRYRRSQAEFASFAAALLPLLARERFDVIHYIDPPLAPWLYRLRRVMRQPARLLFTDAGPVAFDASRWVDHVHCLTPAAAEATRRSVHADRVTMMPVGVDLDALATSSSRDVLRQHAGISPGTLVVLSVTSLNRHHKRVDHLIEEAARAVGDLLLWIDATEYPDGDRGLLDLARTRLGGRMRHTSVPSARVPELYALADVFVSASLQESFGMAIVEAACAGLPVIAHDAPHFRWLLGDVGQYVDMTARDRLSERLSGLAATPIRTRLSEAQANAIRTRFGWAALGRGYERMYGQIASGAVAAPALAAG